ncbi:hypothetical protein KKC74_13450 [bacterium]|nr:hypothetical protein [bacterium]
MNRVTKLVIINIFMVAMIVNCGLNKPDLHQKLAVQYTGDAKLEVGGPYVGVEFHHSCMIPQRISFFYPVANSIDHSRDYWKRDTSFVAEWTFKIGNNPAVSIGRDASEFDLTPYSVIFNRAENGYSLMSSYQFCKDKPAMVLNIQITNTSDKTEEYEFDSRWWTSIRTCHTFRPIEQAWTDRDSTTIYTHFDDPDADFADVFVTNAGDLPTFVNSRIDYLNTPKRKDVSKEIAKAKPVSQFIYQKQLKPGEAMNIVQIIGSSKGNESRSLVSYLKNSYQTEISNYEKYVIDKAYSHSIMETGCPKTDHSVAYAKAVMAVNAHFLEDEIVPMPCPAEYNFYFTHDVLVTDLAAVNFDLERVKRDLDYIIRHADEENIIPHAYYWKDGKYVTEYASSDNWNNFWLVQVSAKYLHHSGDREFAEKLYPYISKSVERSLLTLEDDNLMWSFRPDWWDIGHNYGPRSYMTILAIKTLRDYIFLSTALEKNLDRVQEYMSLANEMQTALVEKLWNEDMNYLVNYHNDGSLDEHYYIGSLLAVHYGLLDNAKQNLLVQTATNKMVDEKVGIYNAFPMDFEKWGDFMKFVGNEAGAKYYYFNGGIWPQGNAWYAMALIANGEKEAAAKFINNTMSLHGIMEGPNGQPAYYEVRNANKDDLSEYGTVDKPQFLWAGAWYINCLYQLYGVVENDWNIALDPFLEKDQKECEFTLYVDGKPLLVSIEGKGKAIKEICYDDNVVSTAVFPESMTDIREVDIELGKPKQPYLASTDAVLKSCEFKKRQLAIHLSASVGHSNNTVVISPSVPKRVSLDGKEITDWKINDHKDYKEIQISVLHLKRECDLVLEF